MRRTSLIKWERTSFRRYSNRGEQLQKLPHYQYIATIFAAQKGYDWAWAVWHTGGTESGVESTFQAAKDRAEEVIEKLMEGKCAEAV